MKSQFCRAVEESFDFLELKHGFRVIERGRTTVVYATESVGVSLFYDDRRSFEVSLGLSQITSPPQPPFSFDEILRALDVPSSEWPTGYAAGSIEAVIKLLARISQIMRRHAATLLEGDVDSWRRLAEQRQSDCIAYAATTSMAHAKRTADAAWAEHNYQKVVSALGAVEGHLGKTDLAKLAYARRAVRS